MKKVDLVSQAEREVFRERVIESKSEMLHWRPYNKVATGLPAGLQKASAR